MATFDSGPIPPQYLRAEPVNPYLRPVPSGMGPMPQPDMSGQGPMGPPEPPPEPDAGIDGPALTPAQVELYRRLAALWGHTGDQDEMGRERESISQLQQSLTPHGKMVGGVYVGQGLGATLLGGALQGGLVTPRVMALRKKQDEYNKAQEDAGRATFQMQGLIPYEKR